MFLLQQMNRKRVISSLPLLLALLVPFLTRLAFVHVPLERDEGAYAYGAWRMMQGETLYRDFVDFSPPGVFFLYQLALRTFGHSVESIRIFTACYVAVAAIWLFFFARELFDRTTAWIAAGIFGFLALEPIVLGFTSNKEVFLLLPLIAGCDLFLRGTRRGGSRGLLLLSGIACALGFFIKQQIAPLAGMLVIYSLLVSMSRRSWKQAATCTFWYATGFSLVCATIAAYFHGRDALSQFAYWNFTYGLEFASRIPPTLANLAVASRSALDLLSRLLAADVLFWLLGAYAYVVSLKQRAWQASFVSCIGIGLAAGISMGLRFREHYFIMVAPLIAVLGARGIVLVLDHLALVHSVVTRSVLATAFLVALVAAPLRTSAALIFRDPPREISRKLFGANPFVEAPVIAEYVAGSTGENDTIFVAGSEPEIYFYAKRKNPTNQLFFYPLTASYGPAPLFQRETIAALQRARPAFIILIDASTSLYASPPVDDRFVFEELARMISSDYRLDGYALIDRDETAYLFGVLSVAPEHSGARISIQLYKRNR